MFRQIYEQLSFDQRAAYQIKIKGRISASFVRTTSGLEITTETSDPRHPITMLSGIFENQHELWTLLLKIYESQYPIVSLSCIEVQLEANQALTSP